MNPRRLSPPVRRPIALAAAIACCAIAGGREARAAENRYVLLSQHVWETQRGFYIDLENGAADAPGAKADATPLPLGTLKLALGVGDGAAWHFASATPAWTIGKPYRIVAGFDGKRATLSLDGKEVGRVDGATLAPVAKGDLIGGQPVDWAKAPTSYAVVERSIRVTADGHDVARHEWPNVDPATNAIARLFAPTATWYEGGWQPAAGTSFEVQIVFSIEKTVGDPRALSPVVDRFGQAAYGAWPTKVTDESQLQGDVADEQARLAKMPPAADVDEYGGDKRVGWRERGTGFYRVVKRGETWWLITPTGLPCFYTGLCTAPMLAANSTPVKGRESLFAALPPKAGATAAAWSPSMWGESDNDAYVSFDAWNLIRKFGDDWRSKAQALTTQRLKSFGFTGLGKWSDAYGGLPHVGCLFHLKDPPSGKGKLDVFDPAAREAFVATLREQIEPDKSDPFLVGWSVGNERAETVLNEDLAAMLAAPGATPAKVALLRRAIETIYANDIPKCASAWKATGATAEQLAAAPLVAPPADVEPLRQWYAGAYYAFVYDAVKSLDANHLYLGYWIVPGWWQNESDWSLMAAHCDVVGYDRYADAFLDPWIEALMKQSDKPALCGEFGYPPTYDGRRGVGAYSLVSTPDDASSGEKYARWIASATRNPWVVGGLWFEYRDQPITGRGPGHGPDLVYDEHYAFGVVDVTDRPKWDLVTRMRDANLKATAERAKP